MNYNNVLEYIKSGLGIAPKKEEFRKIVSGPVIMAFILGLLPGTILGGYRLILSIVMVVTSVFALIWVLILSAHKFTVKNRLILQTIIYIDFILQISLLELILFEPSIFLGIFYLSPVLIPVLLGIKATKKIRKNTPFLSKEIIHSGLRVSGTMAGLAGISFAAIFLEDVSQEIILFILPFGLIIMASFLSIGLLSIQRLYYWYRLQKLGLLPEEFFDSVKDENKKLSSLSEFSEKEKPKEKRRSVFQKILIILAIIIIGFFLLGIVAGILLDKGIIP